MRDLNLLQPKIAKPKLIYSESRPRVAVLKPIMFSLKQIHLGNILTSFEDIMHNNRGIFFFSSRCRRTERNCLF